MPGAHTLRFLKSPPTSAPPPPQGVQDAAPHSQVRCAFVSTNSITQGEQVGVLWSWLLAQGVHIHFAHRTFSWTNEAKGKAAVHCVIIGFGLEDRPGKVIYEYDDIKGDPHAVQAANINPYLVDAPNVFLIKRSIPICAVSPMMEGSALIDDGHFLVLDDEQKQLLNQEPKSHQFLRKLYSGDDFLNGGFRWCLWLNSVPPAELRASPFALTRMELVKRFRQSSNRAATVQLAATPMKFGELRQPTGRYLFVPKTSSERRTYAPIGFMEPSALINNTSLFVDNASLYEFGVMSSNMHNAWVRVTCGRMKSDYRYSSSIVYNNFPWPDFLQSSKPNQPPAPVDKAQAAIETAAQAVLDVRAKFQSGDQPATLADLYDPLSMPPELLKAHQKLDAAVDKAYERSGGKKSYKSDAERVAFLFELYQQYTSLLPADTKKTKIRKPKSQDHA
jgi:hypothetical protein